MTTGSAPVASLKVIISSAPAIAGGGGQGKGGGGGGMSRRIPVVENESLSPAPLPPSCLRRMVPLPRFAGQDEGSFRRGLGRALRQAVAEVRQYLLGDRRHVGPRHLVRHGAELGFCQRSVEAGEVLVFGELFAHRF